MLLNANVYIRYVIGVTTGDGTILKIQLDDDYSNAVNIEEEDENDD